MENFLRMFNKRNTIIFIGAVLVFKIFLSAVLELHPDEAYYWLWSQRLDIGYFDHAPMVAYFIRLTTLFSDGELAVRFSSIIVMIILSILTWAFAIRLFKDEKVAAFSVIVINTMPISAVGAIVITPDTPLFLFYSFAVYFLWRLIESGDKKFWAATGLFLGLALLSKYTAVLFGLSLALYMVLDRKLFWLKEKGFYLMGIIAAAFFIPVILWNVRNDFASFSFQLGHGLSSNKIHFDYVFEYLGAQALVIGPFIFISGIAAAFAYFRSRDSKQIFLACFAIAPIIFFMLTALKRYPGANWPAFAYLFFALMTAQFLLSRGLRSKKILIIGIAFNILMSVLVGIHAKFAIFPVHKISPQFAAADATNWFRGWKFLADELIKRDIKYAFTRQHQWSAAIEYYTKQRVAAFVFADRKNQYAFWRQEPKDFKGLKRARVLVDYEMTDDFTKLDRAEIVTVKKKGVPIRQYAILQQ